MNENNLKKKCLTCDSLNMGFDVDLLQSCLHCNLKKINELMEFKKKFEALVAHLFSIGVIPCIDFDKINDYSFSE